jgi:hypothetical protein
MRALVNWRSTRHGLALTISFSAPTRRQVSLYQRMALIDLAQALTLHHAHLLQPGLELRRRPQTQHLAQVQRIVEGSALVVEHDVVGAGDAHEVIAAGYAKQRHQVVHVVLVGFGVVGVAHVAAHGQAQEFAAEMVFQTGADDLLAVVQIFGADETHHRIHQQRLELPRHAVRASQARCPCGGHCRQRATRFEGATLSPSDRARG